MKKIPHFAGKNSLSLTDLQALADAVPPPCPHVQPATHTRGRVQYDNADYNLAALEADECSGSVEADEGSGSVTRPDSPGMIASVAYAAADEPYIDDGNLVLPLAHDFSPSDSSLPDESATGGITSINVVDALQRPRINRGDIQLPLAQSAWPQTAEGAMYTPGLVYAVQYDPVEDACEGSVLPRIEQGIIHLPAGGGGGDDEDTCPSSCSCVPAQYNLGSGDVTGLISSVAYDSATRVPYIKDGAIFLPVANHDGFGDSCNAHCGGMRAVQMSTWQYGTLHPHIDHGTLMLPYADDQCMSRVTGLVTGISINRQAPDPSLYKGEIRLPGMVTHLWPQDMSRMYPLYELEGCDLFPITMSSCTLADGSSLYLNAWTVCGGLCLQLSTNQYYSV